MISLLKKIALGGVLFAAAAFPLRAGSIVYMSDVNGEPWGLTDFVDAFNRNFGVGNWTQTDYGAGASIFNPANSFIMIEGGDGNSADFDSYFSTPGVVAAEQAWVAAGGSIFVNGGRWTFDDLDVGFGVTMSNPSYADASFTGTAAGPSPIFTAGSGTSWSGGYFSQDIVTGGGLSPLILTDSNVSSLAEMNFGRGHVIVGGLTAPSFWDTQPEGTVLLDNILNYGAATSAVATPDAASTVTLLGAGLVGIGFLRRKKLLQAVRA